jgi:broad specificity phosphatase PhoE
MDVASVTDASTVLPRVYVIRHGETAWSLSGQYTSRTDLPLTDRGQRESRALAERLRAVTFARVLSSPLLRARQTCELAGLGGSMEVEPALTEWDYGDYEGKLIADILQGRPGWNLFRDGCPHGETPTQMCDRVDRLITRLRSLQGNVAICAHGHVGRVIGARWIGLPVTQAEHLLLGTASLSVLGYEHDHAAEPAIVLWNEASCDLPGSVP